MNEGSLTARIPISCLALGLASPFDCLYSTPIQPKTMRKQPLFNPKQTAINHARPRSLFVHFFIFAAKQIVSRAVSAPPRLSRKTCATRLPDTQPLRLLRLPLRRNGSQRQVPTVFDLRLQAAAECGRMHLWVATIVPRLNHRLPLLALFFQKLMRRG